LSKLDLTNVEQSIIFNFFCLIFFLFELIFTKKLSIVFGFA